MREKEMLAACIDTGWISSEGPFVKKFEEEMAHRVERKYGIAVSNGSVALDVSVAAVGLGKGDEVIMPTFTIISCAAAIIRAGATPVLVDSDPCTWNMDVTQIEMKITSKTKAIMVVHIYGLPVNMDPILELSDKYGLKIIEDAAEMLGQTYKGRMCGSFGDVSAFSFYPNKHVTTGEGGMVLTDCEELAVRCRSLRNLCFQAEKRFFHEELGWNFRMTNMQAALGLAQLERLDKSVAKKRRMGKKYTKLLSKFKAFDLPVEKTEYADNIYWVYGIVLREKFSLNAKDVMQRMQQKGIGTRPFFWPMHKQPVFQKMGLFQGDHYPVAEHISRQGFYVPSGLSLNDKQIEAVSIAIKDCLK
jgi:perosamine synthetase